MVASKADMPLCSWRDLVEGHGLQEAAVLEVETQLATSVAQADAADAQHDAAKVGSAAEPLRVGTASGAP